MLYYSLLSVDCVPLSAHDPYGQLKSARLVLSAYLLPFQLWHRHGTRHYLAHCHGQGGIKIYPDIELDYGEDCWTRGSDFYGMPITRTSFKDNFSSSETKTLYTYFGLIVRRKGEGEFERVGLWECGNEDRYYRQRPDKCFAEKLHVMFEILERETVVLV